MDASKQFARYMEHLSEGLGHADRHAGLTGYCTGLMLPLSRKSVEPMAARIDPLHVSAKHQSMHHFVAKAGWSDAGLLARVAQWVSPHMDMSRGGYWIVDDTGFPKKGVHSVGVARQYCGMLGKQDNCQVAVSVSLSCESGSLPVAWQLYLPKAWAEDGERRMRAGVPEQIGFATKPQIALQQIKALRNAQPEGGAAHCVLADAGYGVDSAFRRGLTELGLAYVVGVSSVVSVWPPGVVPAAPLPYSGRGRPPIMPRRSTTRQPMSVKALAHTLPPGAFQTIQWREGSNALLSGRFAALRVRCAGGNGARARLAPEQWLLIEWPADQDAPEKYCLSTLPATRTLTELVHAAHQRFRIERDYQDLKQELGLGHYEGRGWRGFHHHATLAIAAYGFLMAQRLKEGNDCGSKKNFIVGQLPALPKHQRPRGAATSTAPRARLNHHAAPATGELPRSRHGTLHALPMGEPSITFVTQ